MATACRRQGAAAAAAGGHGKQRCSHRLQPGPCGELQMAPMCTALHFAACSVLKRTATHPRRLPPRCRRPPDCG